MQIRYNNAAVARRQSPHFTAFILFYHVYFNLRHWEKYSAAVFYGHIFQGTGAAHIANGIVPLRLLNT